MSSTQRGARLGDKALIVPLGAALALSIRFADRYSGADLVLPPKMCNVVTAETDYN